MIRNNIVPRLLIIPIIACAATNVCASSKKEQQAKELFTRASQLSDIEANDSPPFVLDATVTAHADPKTSIQGNYHLLWKTAKAWRIEMSFPGYHAITVRNGDKVWNTSNLPYEPYLVFQTFQATRFYKRLHIPATEKLGKVHAQKVLGTPLNCVDEKAKGWKPTSFCFDPTGGYLVQQVDPDWRTRFEYSDYAQTGPRKFPHKIYAFQDKQLIIQVDVQALTFNPKIDAAMFSPPTGPNLHEAVDCEGKKIMPPKLIYSIQPRYPESAKANRQQGVVVLYADIGIDGRVRGLSLVQSAGPALDVAAAQAVSQWRYSPEACGGVSLDVLTPIRVDFQMRE